MRVRVADAVIEAKGDISGNLLCHSFFPGLLIFNDLYESPFIVPEVVLQCKHLFSTACEHKKGGEKFLPTDVSCHVAKSRGRVPVGCG